MHRLHGFPCTIGFFFRAVGDEVEGSQRSPEALPEVALVVRVPDDADRDEWMGDLEEHRRPASEKRGERRVSHPPDDALGGEVPVPGCKPLSVGSPDRVASPTTSHETRVPEPAFRPTRDLCGGGSPGYRLIDRDDKSSERRVRGGC